MIVLDTHVWIWLVAGSPTLAPWIRRALDEHERDGLGVSIISCWEVAKSVEVGKLALDRPVEQWLAAALGYPGVRLLDLSLPIVIDSTRLPAPFHRDPGDQMIVATARVLGVPLATLDPRIAAYPHVQTLTEPT